MLRLEEVSCGYGGVRAAGNISFDLSAGGVLALLGPNGAGKTSIIMAIMGHTAISDGRVIFDGTDITREPAVKRASLGIALVPEGRRLFADLTVEENLTVGGYSRSRARDAINRERVYDLFPRLRDRRRQLAGSMSGGEQQMLCFEALAQLRRSGLTVVLVDQNTVRAIDIADTICVLSSGSVVFSGPAAAAKADASLFESFLGRTH